MDTSLVMMGHFCSLSQIYSADQKIEEVTNAADIRDRKISLWQFKHYICLDIFTHRFSTSLLPAGVLANFFCLLALLLHTWADADVKMPDTAQLITNT